MLFQPSFKPKLFVCLTLRKLLISIPKDCTFLHRFGRPLTKEETEMLTFTGDLAMLGIPDRSPQASDFKGVIDHYDALYKRLDAKLETKRIFHHWFQVDCKPFKHALLNTVCKWGFLYKNHLYNHVLDRYAQ